MLKSWGWMVVVAHGILETAQIPNSSFLFLFDFGLGLRTWDLEGYTSPSTYYNQKGKNSALRQTDRLRDKCIC